MPCCCATNVKAAFVWGIIFVIFSLLSCIGTDADGGCLSHIIVGIVLALINGILVYGAHARNTTAILVWIILAIIECVFYAIIGVIVVGHLIIFNRYYFGHDVDAMLLLTPIILVVLISAVVMINIWVIIVAKNARLEIREENVKSEDGPQTKDGKAKQSEALSLPLPQTFSASTIFPADKSSTYQIL